MYCGCCQGPARPRASTVDESWCCGPFGPTRRERREALADLKERLEERLSEINEQLQEA